MCKILITNILKNKKLLADSFGKQFFILMQ